MRFPTCGRFRSASSCAKRTTSGARLSTGSYGRRRSADESQPTSTTAQVQVLTALALRIDLLRARREDRGLLSMACRLQETTRQEVV